MSFLRFVAGWRTLWVVALPLILAFPAAASATVQWTSGESISPAGANASQPDVAALPSGQAIAVWSRFDPAVSKERVQFAIRNSSGVWGSATTISGSTVRGYEPKIATDPNGNATAVWTVDTGTDLNVQTAYRPSGGSFGAIQTLNTSAREPEVSMDAQGNAVAVWIRFDASVGKDRIQAATRPAGTGSTFGAVDTLSTSAKNAFEPVTAAEANGNAVAAWTIADGTLEVQSSSKLDVPGYPRPSGGSQVRVPLMIAFKQCTGGSVNRTHGAGLITGSCNPQQQESDVLTVGTFDANGFQPQNSGFVKVIVCPNGTTGSGACATPAGMTSPDLRLEATSTDVRCRVTNAACPGGFGSDYGGKLLLRLPLRLTDKNNGTLGNDPATTQDTSFNVPVPCTLTGTSIGSQCNVLTRANAVLAGSIVAGKRQNWELGQIELRDAGPNGTGYDSCPPTCGDGDEKTFARQGFFVP